MNSSIKVKSASFTHAGPKGRNEDAYLPPCEVRGVWWTAIADGMGGHLGGEVASNSVIERVLSQITSDPEIKMSSLFEAARERLDSLAGSEARLAKMGTTLSVVRLNGSHAEVGHVGDSRVYHLRDGGIMTRTKDQTEVQKLVEEGILSKASARRYPRRNVLLSVLAPNRDYELHCEEFEVQPGDRLVLLTDGLYGKVFRREILNLSMEHSSPKELCAALEEEVRAKGPKDDYTAICMTIKSISSEGSSNQSQLLVG